MVGGDGSEGTVFTARRVRWIAVLWCLIWPPLMAAHVLNQLRAGWTDGVDRPFGEDFLNFWSAAKLAISSRWHSIYNIPSFHEFQVGVVGHPIDLYHYSYPPTLLILTAPFAVLPYPAAWVAWQILGWLAFAGALRRISPDHWLLAAIAWPAIPINAIGGQAACWLAAITAWGLILLPKRPVVAGLLLSLLAVKPQLSWLVPLALLFGQEWKALIAMAIGTAALLLVTTFCFGVEIWPAYAAQAQLLKRFILEDGSGTWHRMISVFVLVRHLGAPLWVAYGAQAIVSSAVAWLVLTAWARGSALRSHFLMVGMLAGSIYVSDYDCVMLAFPALALWQHASPAQRWPIVLAGMLPLVAAVLAVSTNVAIGAVMLWPLLAMLWQMQQRPMAQGPIIAATRSPGTASTSTISAR